MTKKSEYYIYAAFAIAFIGLVGSLYFSEVMDLPPCKLCWLERVAMYPLVPILAAGIIRAERAVVAYALPLTVIGFLIAAYHNLLYWGIIPERLAPCELGVSCTTKFFEWLGFITIPFMALSGFLVIGTLLVLYSRQSKTDPVQ